MAIYSIEGNQRTGKNVLSTLLAIHLAQLSGCPIYANYTLTNLPPGVKFVKFEKFSEIVRDARNAIVVFDEIGTTMDARSWNGREQTLFTHFFAQMGKNGNTFISTAQRPWLVEKRVREQADFVIWCDKNPLSGIMTEDWYDTRQGRSKARLIGCYVMTRPELAYDKYNTLEKIGSHVKFNDQIR